MTTARYIPKRTGSASGLIKLLIFFFKYFMRKIIDPAGHTKSESHPPSERLNPTIWKKAKYRISVSKLKCWQTCQSFPNKVYSSLHNAVHCKHLRNKLQNKLATLAFILDGNSEIAARIRRNLCYLICLRHLIWSRAVTDWIFFFPIKPILLHVCATCSQSPSNISTIIATCI